MQSKNIFPTLAAFICFVTLCRSSEDVINRLDSIKDHTLDITVVRIRSQDELIEIWNEIDRHESVEIGRIRELDKIKTGILKLNYVFEELMKQQISSVKYEKIKASYEEQMRSLVNRLDDEKKKSKGKVREMVAKLNKEFQKQQAKISKALKHLEKEQNGLNEAYVRLCVEHIDQTEIGKAVLVFKNITKPKEIKTIVLSSYLTKPENYEKIVTFVRQVADPESMLIGYTALFEEMIKQNQLRDQRILILANELRTNTDPIFKEFKTTLMAMIDEMVLENDFAGLINYANTEGESKDMDFVKQIMPMIVEKVYNKPTDMIFGNGDDSTNVEFLLSMLSKFSNLDHQMYMITDLARFMDEAGHTKKRSMFLVVSKGFEIVFKVTKYLNI